MQRAAAADAAARSAVANAEAAAVAQKRLAKAEAREWLLTHTNFKPSGDLGGVR